MGRARDRAVRRLICVALLAFGNGRQLSISIDGPQGIQPGLGLHRLIFPVKLDARNTIVGGVSVVLSGCAWLTNSGMEWLGTWTTDLPLATNEGYDFSGTIVLPLTDEQIAVIEQRRAGRDLMLQINANVVLGYDPGAADGSPDDRWPVRPFQESLHIYGETWERYLRQTSASFALTVVLPVPLTDSAGGRVGKHLRDAILKVNQGEYGDAVMAARKAVEGFGKDWVAEKAIVDTPKDDRSLEQRLAMLRHSLHALASPSAHSDDVADSIHWDRENAMAVIAGVAALAACKD